MKEPKPSHQVILGVLINTRVYSLLPGVMQQMDGIKLMPEENQWGRRKGEKWYFLLLLAQRAECHFKDLSEVYAIVFAVKKRTKVKKKDRK